MTRANESKENMSNGGKVGNWVTLQKISLVSREGNPLPVKEKNKRKLV